MIDFSDEYEVLTARLNAITSVRNIKVAQARAAIETANAEFYVEAVPINRRMHELSRERLNEEIRAARGRPRKRRTLSLAEVLEGTEDWTQDEIDAYLKLKGYK